MQFPAARTEPYLRALIAGLSALAPNEDYVPLQESLAHLSILRPEVSGEMFAPAEFHPETGMPAFIWMERPLAEQVVATENSPHTDATDEELATAQRLDPVLGTRLHTRRATHRALRRAGLLPRTRLGVALKRLRGETTVTVTFDRMEPLGLWARIRVDLTAPAGQTIMGPITVQSRSHMTIDPGFEHLLTRHSTTPFIALRAALEEVTPASTITRLARAHIGPFWFPGVTLPDQVPPSLGTGLLLHTSVQILGRDVHHSEHHDPLNSPFEQSIPAGFGVYQQRQFATTDNLRPALEQWCRAKECRCPVVSLLPGAKGIRTPRTL